MEEIDYSWNVSDTKNICFQGTSADQDNRFSDKEKKLLKQMKFEDSLANKIEMKKVKLDVMKPWISERVLQLLGMFFICYY